MNTVGIIAEYNPFHNGHAYQLAKAKEITGADHCIVVMSGNFVQRGVPAMMDKYLRTRAALLSGADLVIELPVHYATASAEYFASGAVALLDRLGVTDYLCFGSECGDLHALSSVADMLLSEDDGFKSLIKQRLKSGMSYPQARNDAFCAALPHLAEQADILKSPNNILGLEYLKALKKRNSRITPYTIVRKGAGYHEDTLQSSYSSALAIRESISAKNDIRFMKEQVPDSVYELMEISFGKSFPILPDDISALLAYRMLQCEAKGFRRYFDIDDILSDRIKKCLPAYRDFTSFCNTLKTKNMTYTRIARSLLHLLLDLSQEDIDVFRAEDYVYYARILGFKKESAPLLSAMKADSSIPLIIRLANDAKLITSPNGRKMLQQDIRASHIYSLLIQQKFGQNLQNEYRQKVITL